RWGKLTDDDLAEIDGEKDKLVGKLQEKYGKSREEAEKELENW
ncbi:MAG TPA: general stress protein CsbD, partial [Oceanicaulis sp.]|nr:general stress protein CsbD [Oceanicaulis sp.]